MGFLDLPGETLLPGGFLLGLSGEQRNSSFLEPLGITGLPPSRFGKSIRDLGEPGLGAGKPVGQADSLGLPLSELAGQVLDQPGGILPFRGSLMLDLPEPFSFPERGGGFLFQLEQPPLGIDEPGGCTPMGGFLDLDFGGEASDFGSAPERTTGAGGSREEHGATGSPQRLAPVIDQLRAGQQRLDPAVCRSLRPESLVERAPWRMVCSIWASEPPHSQSSSFRFG